MNKYYIASFFAFAFTFAAHAQSSTNNELQHLLRNSIAGDNPQHRTNALSSRLIASSYSVYKTSSSSYIKVDTYAYRYSNGRGGDLNNPINADVSIWGIYGSGIIDTAFLDTYTYNANNKVITQVTASTGPFGAVNNNFLYTYRYNSQNLLADDSSYGWYPPGSSWHPYKHHVYNYDTANRLVLKSEYLAYGPMTPTELTKWTYDTAGSIITKIIQHDYGQGMFTMNYDSFSYNNNRQKISYTAKEWDPTDSSLYYQHEYRYTYNSNNNVAEELFYKLNIRHSVFDTQSKLLHTYDANNNLVETITQWYDANSRTFTNLNKINYTYNNHNQVISKISTTYDNNGNWILADNDIAYYYYYELHFPTTVAQLPQQGGTLQLYPVPTANTLYLQLSEQQQQQYSLSITDIQGRQVLQQTYTGNTIQAINTSALPTGVYNLSLLSTNGHIQHSRFSIAR